MARKIPSFLSFYDAEEDDLKIPIIFTQCMDDPYPQRVYLRDCHRQKWAVKVKEIGDYCCFVDGWDRFVNDNSVTTGDLLVFAYIQREIFDVKIYGTCGTEKNIIRPADEEVDDDIDQEWNQVIVGNANNGGGGNIMRRRPEAPGVHHRCYGVEIFEAGIAPRPINAYFVAKYSPKRSASLFIPDCTVKDFNITIQPEIILVDPERREFKSEVRWWSDGRCVVAKGWNRLCRVNAVKEGNQCICEFVQREGDRRQYLHISFVRGNI